MLQKCTERRCARIVILAVEILLIIKMLLSFLQPRIACSFFIEDMQSSGAIEVELNGKGWYVDNSIDLNETTFLQTLPMNLTKGVYKIVIHHQIDGDGTNVNFLSDNITYRLIAGRQNLKLNCDQKSTEYEIYLSESQENFKINFDFTGDGYAWISSVDIMQLWNMERLTALYTIIIIGVLEIAWRGYAKKKFEKILLKESFVKSIMTGLLISIPVGISTLPCFSYYLLDGFDLNFHLMRIEGIAEAIKSGSFPARIQTNWLNGYGYPVSIFYGDGLLYIPAFFRMIGMSLQNAYKCYIFLMNAITAVTMYLAARGMTKSRKMAILASYLYLLLPYRLSCIYTRAGVGEYSAMAFFPLIVWGLYRVCETDTKAKEWKYVWIIPTIGFTGVIESHLLSTILVGLFTVICCIILFKKTLEKTRFIALMKVVAATVAANALYLIPILDYMQKEYRVMNNAQEAQIQTQGAFISQIFSIMPVGEGISLSVTENLSNVNEIVLSLGIVPWIGVVALGIYFVLSMRRKALNLEKYHGTNAIYMLLVMALVSTWMSSMAFPWDALTEKMGVFKVIFTSLQFPWRYLSIASVLMVLGIVLTFNSELVKKDLFCEFHIEKIYLDILSVCLVVLVVLSAGTFTSNLITEGEYKYIIAGCDLDTTKIQGAEYIPAGVSEGALMELSVPESRGADIDEYHSDARDCVLTISKVMANGNISVPRIYYDGYAVKLDGKNGWFDCYSDDLGRVCFDLPQGYEGQAIVRFREPWYWRVSEVVSIITIVEMLYILGVKKYGKQEK